MSSVAGEGNRPTLPAAYARHVYPGWKVFWSTSNRRWAFSALALIDGQTVEVSASEEDRRQTPDEIAQPELHYLDLDLVHYRIQRCLQQQRCFSRSAHPVDTQ